ncbi:hypothetical protein GH714_027882 [Hevea brasiliensis]|uniref:C3H1-type domain-containing protein n=1 Tax=Hevea brasiliensis TaxID=3981 RepID=A0A6A6MEC1_HEVBR|nr:hypothetical protein GH714_027882 [Hevea brasiliensis]
MDNSIGTVEAEHSFSVLLEYAADNDVEGFKRTVCDESEIMEVGLWYGHQRVLKRGVLEHRTPLMVAAKYGSVEVLKLILSLPEVDVNFSCGPDQSTALHCAASGGSVNVIDAIKLLLLAGADPNSTDANGHRPIDVIVASPNFPYLKFALEKLLKNDGSASQSDLQVSTNCLRSSLPSISLLSEEGSSFSISGSILSPITSKINDVHISSAKKEYHVDPSVPDITNSIYATDEFRMFSFKIQPCSRAYSHDWTECPFVHPGENARRRDPRRFHYSCVPCPDHRKGACRRGDLCEFSHGIFECWLHPAQYRTRLCKDGTSCIRRVCFFAHTSDELRPLYASTGAAVPSPQAAAVDFTAALNLLSGSPSAVSAVSPLSFTPPMSASRNDLRLSMAWPQQNILNLKILSNNLQANRLRTSLNARDIPSEEFNGIQDFELQQLRLLNELSCISQPYHNSSSANLKQLNASVLDRLLSYEVSSPQNIYQLGAAPVFFPSYKPAVLNEFQQQSMLSPIKTGVFSPKNVDYSPFQASFDCSSPMKMLPQLNEPTSPLSSQLSTLARSEKLQLQLGSLSSQEIGSNLTYNGVNVDWSIREDEVGLLQKLYSNGNCGEEPDVSWVQSVLKDSPSETEEKAISVSGSLDDSSSNPQSESSDHVACQAWLEGLKLDQIVA